MPIGSTKVVVSAFDAAGTNLTKDAKAETTVNVADQATVNATIGLSLLDGVSANGDISATVNITNGVLVAPAVAIQ